MRKIKDKFRQLPAVLKKQVLIRGVLGITALFLFVIIMIYTMEFSFGLPCIILSLFMIVNSTLLLYNCIKGKYVVINGICEKVERTAIRKRVRSLGIRVGNMFVTVPIRFRLKAPSVNDEITVYLSEKTPVYEKDGGYSVYSFYALEVKRKV